MRSLRVLILTVVMLWAAKATLYAESGELSQNDVIERIVTKCSSMESMRCEFSQVRHVPLLEESYEGVGYMLYKSPSSVKWAYTDPISYSMAIDGNKITIQDSARDTKLIGGDGVSVVMGMSRMMIGCMTGESLRDTRTFAITVTQEDDVWRVELKPKKRDLSRLFAKIVLVFNPSDALLRELIMSDQGGGTTEITFNSVSLNGNYDSEW